MANNPNRFNFRILENTDAYEQIPLTDIEQMTFYLTKDGAGWFNGEALFGGDADKFNIITTGKVDESTLKSGNIYVIPVDGVTHDVDDGTGAGTTVEETYAPGIYYHNGTKLVNSTYDTIAKYIAQKAIKEADIDIDNMTTDDETIMTSAAIAKYVEDSINDQAILDINFFKQVINVIVIDDGGTLKVVNAEDNSIEYTLVDASVLNNAHKDDRGLVFVIESGEDEDPDTDDTYTFVNLHNLMQISEVVDGDTTTVTSSTSADGHKVSYTVEVNKSAHTTLASKIDEEADKLADGTSTFDDTGLSDNAFITEKKFAEVLANILKDYVKYSE